MRIKDLEYAMLCLFNESCSDLSDEYKMALIMSLKPEWRQKINWKFCEIMFEDLQYPLGILKNASGEQYNKFYFEAQSKFDSNKVLESLFQKIEELWDVNLSEIHRKELINHLIGIYSQAVVFEKHKKARPSDFTKKLTKIIKKGNEFIDAIEEYEKESVLPMLNILNEHSYLKNKLKEIQDETSALKQVLDVSRKIIDLIKNSHESGYQISLPKLMFKTLGLLYQDITGERPTITYNSYTEEYSGKFLMFCNLLNQDILWTNDQIAYLTKKFFPPPAAQ